MKMIYYQHTIIIKSKLSSLCLCCMQNFTSLFLVTLESRSPHEFLSTIFACIPMFTMCTLYMITQIALFTKTFSTLNTFEFTVCKTTTSPFVHCQTRLISKSVATLLTPEWLDTFVGVEVPNKMLSLSELLVTKSAGERIGFTSMNTE